MRILLTSAGGPAAIGVARSLKLAGHYLIGMDCNPHTLVFAETDEQILGPRADDPHYLDFLNALIESSGAEFVHAQADPEVLVISSLRDRIRAMTFLPLHQTVVLCQDKYACNKVLAMNGVASPATIPLKSWFDLDRAWSTYMPGTGKMWVRANTGAAGRGAYLAKAGTFPFIEGWINEQHGWGSFQAAEYLPGRCVTWQSLWKDGKLIAGQGRERLEWHHANRAPSGVTGVTGVAVTIDRPDVNAEGERAVRAVEPTPNGIFGVDMKENADGVPCVTEINIGRFFTTIEFFARAGLNFPDLYVRAGMGERIKPQPSLEPGWMWLRSMDSAPKLRHQ